jgi:hypothetical protein
VHEPEQLGLAAVVEVPKVPPGHRALTPFTQ